MSSSTDARHSINLQRECERKLRDLTDAINSVYETWAEPLAGVLTVNDSRLFTTYQQPIPDMVWSYDSKHSNEMLAIAREIWDANLPSATDGRLRDLQKTIYTSLSWFSNTRERRQQLGITRPADQPRFKPRPGLNMPAFYRPGIDSESTSGQ